MKFTGENLTHMGFHAKARLSVSQCWRRGKRETKSVVPDVEKPNHSAAGFLFFSFYFFGFSSGCLTNRYVLNCPNKMDFHLLSKDCRKADEIPRMKTISAIKKKNLQLNNLQEKNLTLIITESRLILPALKFCEH